ncbi:MAG: HAD family hydrolase [Acidimicrobiales bacterium]
MPWQTPLGVSGGPSRGTALAIVPVEAAVDGDTDADVPFVPHVDGALLLTDLMSDFATVAELLLGRLLVGDVLDCFLLAGAANQILEDHLQPDRRLLRWAVSADADVDCPVRARSRLTQAALATCSRLDRLALSHGELCQLQWDLAALVERLAIAVMDGGAIPASELGRMADDVKAMLFDRATLPEGLSRAIVRLPSCFRSFDQRPADVHALVERFAERWPDRRRPLMAVGIRTSGSYLAPLAVASLRQLGYRDVEVLTVRPGAALPVDARAMLRRLVRAGGMAVILDDPPSSGQCVASVSRQLQHRGLPTSGQVIAIATFDETGQLPHALRSIPQIVLPWSQWAVHRQLQPAAVARVVQRLLPRGHRVLDVRRGAAPDHPGRGHATARFTVEIARGAGTRITSQLAVEGAGLGYLGRHALAIAGALAGMVPDVYGFDGGLLYRRWLPDETRCGPSTELTSLIPKIALHVAARHHALPVSTDRSVQLSGRQAAWEVAADMSSRSLGRFRLPLRAALVDPVIRPILQSPHPSVVDGRTGLQKWFVPHGGRVAKKVDFAEGGFGHLDLCSYDAVFDLAGVATELDEPAHVELLRSSFEGLTGTSVDEERWLLYELVHLWNAGRLGQMSPDTICRASARAVQRYFASRFLSDLEPSQAGPCCAVDLDGVLETDPLGFPATTTAGAIALRSLIAHGYRPLLVTGRSLADVAERCSAYRLQGGVAEYGAAVYDRTTETVLDLLPTAGAELLASVRAVLSQRPGIHIDPAYQRVVRAYRLDERGRRRGLDSESIGVASDVTHGSLRVEPVRGEGQTDFTVAGLHKGTGLRVLLDQLDAGPGPGGRLALAVGDSGADIPSLELARLRLVPSNADTAVRRSGGARVVGAPYQGGLLLAVGRLLGHRPGGCPTCATPLFSPREKSVMLLLSMQEAGWKGGPRRLAALALAALNGGAPT